MWFKLKRIYEWLDVGNIEIPDETKEWCLKFHLRSSTSKSVPEITKDMVKESKKLLEENCDGFLYRGIQMELHEYEQALNKGYVDNKYWPSSWTWDEETARAFAYPYGGVGLIMKKPLKSFKKYFCMDVVMENVTEEDRKRLMDEKDDFEFGTYVSESEVVVFDKTVDVPMKDVRIIKSKDKK